MARVKLTLPETFCFSTEMPLRITDINYGGHLGNDSVLTLAHEARVRFLNSLGFSEIDACGAGLIMTDAVVVFRAEGTYGMNLEIKIAIGDTSPIGWNLFYLLTDKDSGKEVARVKTGLAFFDYQRKRPVKMPAPFKEKINQINNV